MTCALPIFFLPPKANIFLTAVLTENGLQAEVIGFKPDPNAPPVQIFDHNANGSTPSAQLATPAIPGQNIVSNEEIKLAVPYYAQKDNSINPDYSCQATSLAMALEFLGVKGAGTQRFADEIYAKLSSRGVPGTYGLMADLVREYGKTEDYEGSLGPVGNRAIERMSIRELYCETNKSSSCECRFK